MKNKKKYKWWLFKTYLRVGGSQELLTVSAQLDCHCYSTPFSKINKFHFREEGKKKKKNRHDFKSFVWIFFWQHIKLKLIFFVKKQFLFIVLNWRQRERVNIWTQSPKVKWTIGKTCQSAQSLQGKSGILKVNIRQWAY